LIVNAIRNRIRRHRRSPPREPDIDDRFRSGDRCPITGLYTFDGYLNESTTSPLPPLDQRRIWLRTGERLPSFALWVEDAWWKLVARRASGMRLLDAELPGRPTTLPPRRRAG
jgi:hypothetical protein